MRMPEVSCEGGVILSLEAKNLGCRAQISPGDELLRASSSGRHFS
jgi:hypothetical protein